MLVIRHLRDRWSRMIFAVALALLLSGCTDVTEVRTKYDPQKDDAVLVRMLWPECLRDSRVTRVAVRRPSAWDPVGVAAYQIVTGVQVLDDLESKYGWERKTDDPSLHTKWFRAPWLTSVQEAQSFHYWYEKTTTFTVTRETRRVVEPVESCILVDECTSPVLTMHLFSAGIWYE